MNHIDQHVGSRLRDRRLLLQRSLSEQAALLGISERELAAHETGDRRVSPLGLFGFCQSLGLKPFEVFAGLELSFPPGPELPPDRRV